MSAYDTSDQNAIGSDGQTNRREMQIRLKLKELDLVRLRRRITRLENHHRIGHNGSTDELDRREAQLLNELDDLGGKR